MIGKLNYEKLVRIKLDLKDFDAKPFKNPNELYQVRPQKKADVRVCAPFKNYLTFRHFLRKSTARKNRFFIADLYFFHSKF